MRIHHPPFIRIPCFKRSLVDLAKAGVIDLLRWVSGVMRSALDSTREIKSPTVLQPSPYSHGMNRRAILTKRSTLFQSGSFFCPMFVAREKCLLQGVLHGVRRSQRFASSSPSFCRKGVL